MDWMVRDAPPQRGGALTLLHLLAFMLHYAYEHLCIKQPHKRNL